MMRSSESGREPTLVFDGDCGFCTWAARWILDHADAPVRAVPWQEADLDRLGLREEDARRTVWWVEPGTPDAAGHAAGHLAIARALLRSRGPWPLAGRTLLLPGIDRLAAAGYEFVARNRGRFPGVTPACRADWPAGGRRAGR